MTKEQRVLNVIQRKPVDFLPSQITFSDRTRDAAISKAVGLDSPDQLDDYLQNHIGITLTLTDTPLFYRNDLVKMRELEEKGYCGVDVEGGIVYDTYGMGVKIGEDGFFYIFSPLGGNKEANKRAEKFLPPNFNKELLYMDLEKAMVKYEAPDPYMAGNFDDFERDMKNNKDNLLMMPSGYYGTFERTNSLLGWEEYMVQLSINPKLVCEMMEKVTDHKVEVAKKAIKMGFKIGHYGDDLGTQTFPFFSRKMFNETIKPSMARIFKVYKDAGLPVALHSCGCIMDYLPDLIDIGLDIWEPVQPCNDLKVLKREYGKDLVFWGGIDTQTLPYLKPDEVREMATETIRILGKGGGHIIAPSQEIMNDVPLENVVALVETIVKERERVI